MRKLILTDIVNKLNENLKVKIDDINYNIYLNLNFSNPIIHFLPNSNKDHDLYLANEDEINIDIEKLIKSKLKFKSIKRINNKDMGGIMISIDKDELLNSLLKNI